MHCGANDEVVVMHLDTSSNKPLYVQIAEGVEEDIMNNILVEGGRAYSQYQVSAEYNVNPATAAKGIKLLEQESILVKKRGLGMFVVEGAKAVIVEKRKNIFVTDIIQKMINEAKKLGLCKEDVISIIQNMEEI